MHSKLSHNRLHPEPTHGSLGGEPKTTKDWAWSRRFVQYSYAVLGFHIGQGILSIELYVDNI